MIDEKTSYKPVQTETNGKAKLIILTIVIFALAIVITPDLALLLFCAFVLSLGAITYLRSESDQGNIGRSQISGSKTQAGPNTDAHSMLIDALQFPAYILDHKGSVIHANKSSHLAFGKIKLSERIFIRFRQPELRQLIGKALREQASLTGEYNEPIPDDKWFTVEIAPIPNHGKTTSKPNFLLGFHDLSEAKKIDQMRSDFIANASHELRTPLASLLGYIETIKGPARKDEKAIDRFTDVMLDQAHRMTRLVNDLLSLSRIEMQSHVKPSQLIDLNEVVASVVDSLEGVAKRLSVKIELNSIGTVRILGDRDALLQVFENLIENACKYGEEGGKVIVSLELDEAEKQVTVCVQDFGPGIAMEHQHRITERFYRVDVARSREKQGTGLGLAIVKHILNRHSTKLGIDSKPDEGARFFVTFPVQDMQKK